MSAIRKGVMRLFIRENMKIKIGQLVLKFITHSYLISTTVPL